MAASLGSPAPDSLPIALGEDLRGGGILKLGLESLISRHVAVLGSSGQGKSCFTAAVLQQIVRFPQARIVIFDINDEYQDAFDIEGLPEGAVKRTTLGGYETNSLKIPYFALGRSGLNRLLAPSERTQRPALTFALENLRHVKWFPKDHGVGLGDDTHAILFDDCRSSGAVEADGALRRLRAGDRLPPVGEWPPMMALSALVAESHALQPKNNSVTRDGFLYGNVSPLITRINRFAEDPMFTDVVSVGGRAPTGGQLDWRSEATALVEKIFGGQSVNWRVHIINLRRVAHDLTPFVLGSLLELYAFELFRRGQQQAIPTLLVLEEAHHYMRPIGSGDEAQDNALAYERLAKEGRKFGLALWLSTQRPSEISPTVLSQCNNWITFRLTSEKDLNAVQAASEWADRREVRRIAGLARQHAVVFGGSITMPTILRAPDAVPRPRSDDGNFLSWGTERSIPTQAQGPGTAGLAPSVQAV
jgi:hypothetical protein